MKREPPGTPAVGRRRHLSGSWQRALRVVLFVALVAGIYGLLPRLGDLRKEARVLRHAQLSLLVASVAAEFASLATYVLFFRQVLESVGARVTYRLAGEVTMSSFFVSHVAVGGGAAGTVVNFQALRAEGVPTEAVLDAEVLTPLLSAGALVAVFAVGLVMSLGRRRLSTGYFSIAGIAVALIVIGFAAVGMLARRPALAARLGQWAGSRRLVRKWSKAPADEVAANARALAVRARGALSSRRFIHAFAPAVGELLLDALALYLFFVALGYRPQVGAVLVAYGVANMLAGIPVTPAGLGVIEPTLIAVMVAFGAPGDIAVPAVLGYRVANYWLPLPIGAASYVDLQRRQHEHSGR